MKLIQKKLLSKQYFDTEDLGYIKNKKHLFIVGRNNQIIKRRGFLINLNLIESIALKHPLYMKLKLDLF